MKFLTFWFGSGSVFNSENEPGSVSAPASYLLVTWRVESIPPRRRVEDSSVWGTVVVVGQHVLWFLYWSPVPGLAILFWYQTRCNKNSSACHHTRFTNLVWFRTGYHSSVYFFQTGWVPYINSSWFQTKSIFFQLLHHQNRLSLWFSSEPSLERLTSLSCFYNFWQLVPGLKSPHCEWILPWVGPGVLESDTTTLSITLLLSVEMSFSGRRSIFKTFFHNFLHVKPGERGAAWRGHLSWLLHHQGRVHCQGHSQVQHFVISFSSHVVLEHCHCTSLADLGWLSRSPFFPIPVLKTTKKKKVKNFLSCITFLCSHKFHKIENFLIFRTSSKKDLSYLTKNLSIFNPKNVIL